MSAAVATSIVTGPKHCGGLARQPPQKTSLGPVFFQNFEWRAAAAGLKPLAFARPRSTFASTRQDGVKKKMHYASRYVEIEFD